MKRIETNRFYILDGFLSGMINYHTQDSVNRNNRKMQEEVNNANLQATSQTNAYNEYIAEMTNQANKEIADSVNLANKEIASENLQYQRDVQNYNKALQQKLFEREDSSYQRTVNDMRRAGLSPLAMNGTNGAGEAIQIGALNNNYQAQGYTAQGSTAVAPSFQASRDEASKFNIQGNILKDIYQIKSMREQVKAQELDNEYNQSANYYRFIREASSAISSTYDSLTREDQYKYDKFYGINSHMGEKERIAHIIAKQFGFDMVDPNGNPKVLGQEAFKKFQEVMSKSSNSASSTLPDVGKLVDTANKVNKAVDKVESVKKKVNETKSKWSQKLDSARNWLKNHSVQGTPQR